jgi:hypothetical protein
MVDLNSFDQYSVLLYTIRYNHCSYFNKIVENNR